MVFGLEVFAPRLTGLYLHQLGTINTMASTAHSQVIHVWLFLKAKDLNAKMCWEPGEAIFYIEHFDGCRIFIYFPCPWQLFPASNGFTVILKKDTSS